MTGAALCRAQAVRRESPDPKSARRRGSGAGANLRFTPRRAGRPAEPSGRLPSALNGADILHPHSAFRQRSCLRPRPSRPPPTVSGAAPRPSMLRAPRTGSGPPRCRPQCVPRYRDPQLPEAHGKAGGAHALAGMPACRGRLAAGAVLRNCPWPPWSRLRQGLHRLSLQNPRLPRIAGAPNPTEPPAGSHAHGGACTRPSGRLPRGGAPNCRRQTTRLWTARTGAATGAPAPSRTCRLIRNRLFHNGSHESGQ